MVLGQLPRAFRTHLDVPESPWNPGVWGWKTPKKDDWHFVRFRCGICPLMNRALSIFRAALRATKVFGVFVIRVEVITLVITLYDGVEKPPDFNGFLA